MNRTSDYRLQLTAYGTLTPAQTAGIGTPQVTRSVRQRRGNVRAMKRYLSSITIAVLISSGLNAAEIERAPFDLSSTDKLILEQIACFGPRGVGASSLKAYHLPPDPRIIAYIQCLPHDTYEQHELLTRVECAKDDGRWVCQPGDLQVIIPNRHGTDTITLIRTTEKEAIELVAYLDSLAPDAPGGWSSAKPRILSRIDRDDTGAYVMWEDNVGLRIVIHRACTHSECAHVVERVWFVD